MFYGWRLRVHTVNTVVPIWLCLRARERDVHVRTNRLDPPEITKNTWLLDIPNRAPGGAFEVHDDVIFAFGIFFMVKMGKNTVTTNEAGGHVVQGGSAPAITFGDGGGAGHEVLLRQRGLRRAVILQSVV